jgi:hypothetical protein
MTLLIRSVGLSALVVSAFAAPASAVLLSPSVGITTPAYFSDGLAFVMSPSDTTAGLFQMAPLAKTLAHGTPTSWVSGVATALPTQFCAAIWRKGRPSTPFGTVSSSVIAVSRTSVDCSNLLTFLVGDEPVALQTESQVWDAIAGTSWISETPFYVYVTHKQQPAR